MSSSLLQLFLLCSITSAGRDGKLTFKKNQIGKSKRKQAKWKEEKKMEEKAAEKERADLLDKQEETKEDSKQSNVRRTVAESILMENLENLIQDQACKMQMSYKNNKSHMLINPNSQGNLGNMLIKSRRDPNLLVNPQHAESIKKIDSDLLYKNTINKIESPDVTIRDNKENRSNNQSDTPKAPKKNCDGFLFKLVYFAIVCVVVVAIKFMYLEKFQIITSSVYTLEETETDTKSNDSDLPIMMGGIAGTAVIGGGAYYFWPEEKVVKKGWFS